MASPAPRAWTLVRSWLFPMTKQHAVPSKFLSRLLQDTVSLSFLKHKERSDSLLLAQTEITAHSLALKLPSREVS